MTQYRIVQREDGWAVEILDGLPVRVGSTVVSEPEWELAAGPFASQEEAEREMTRLQNE